MSSQISTEFTPLSTYLVFKELLSITLKIKEKNMVSATPKNAHRIYGLSRVPLY